MEKEKIVLQENSEAQENWETYSGMRLGTAAKSLQQLMNASAAKNIKPYLVGGLKTVNLYPLVTNFIRCV